MDRKDFIKNMAGTLFIGLPVFSILNGCTGDDDNSPPSNNSSKDCLANGTKSTIGSNHGHTLQVSKEDVENGINKEYSISGSSGHDHNVTVTADNFNTLKNNQQIQLNSSSGNGHTHSITISCA